MYTGTHIRREREREERENITHTILGLLAMYKIAGVHNDVNTMFLRIIFNLPSTSKPLRAFLTSSICASRVSSV